MKTSLIKRKKREAIFLGCGPSINDITPEQWDRINNDMDSWASNNWIIHDFVPDFYHLELKKHRNGPTFKRLITKKQEQYKDVNWILDHSRPYLKDYVNPKVFPNIYYYKKINRKNCDGYHTHPSKVHLSCNASLSIILDIMLKTRTYKKIYLAGVDLVNSKYFWTDNSEYDHLEIPDIIKTCKPDERSPSDPHPTHKMAVFFNEMARINATRIINTTEKSALKDFLPTEEL